MSSSDNENINQSNNEILKYLEKNLLEKFINDNFTNEELDITKKEINYIFNNLISDKCYILKLNSNQFSISGLSNNISNYDFIFLIPNVLRQCYVLDRLVIPNICIKYIRENNIYQFYPKLLDEEIIKSFLYFAVPVNITFVENYYSNIYSIINIDKSILEIKKINTTYGSYTTAVEIYNMIYGNNTLLSNLVNFKYYIEKSYNENIISIIDNNFNINWEFTQGCINNSLYVKDTYINGNVKLEYKLTSITAYNIYKINNILTSESNNESNNDFNNDLYIKNYIDKILFSNLNYLLKIAFNVYQDIITEIQYRMNGLKYCKKSYMDKSNIPLLLELYKNFYNNQIESNKREIPKLTIRSVEPVNTSIYAYANVYKINFLNIFTTLYFLKTVYLNTSQALIFFTNVNNWKESIPNANIIKISIYVFFLDITQPNPTGLTDYNDTFPDYDETYTTVDAFVNNFNTKFKKRFKDVTSVFLNSYNNGGLFPEGGTISNSQNLGYVYAYYQKNKLLYKIYLTLESYDPYNPPDSNGKGAALIFYK